RLLLWRSQLALPALAADQSVARLLLSVGAADPRYWTFHIQHFRFYARLPALGFSESPVLRTALDGRLDFDPFRHDLHVVDGDLLRQYDHHAFRTGDRGGTPPRNRNQIARREGHGRQGQPGEIHLSCQDEP